MMMPNGINLRAKNASWGAIGRYRLETWKSVILREKYWFGVIHPLNFRKSSDFAAYIRKFCFWGLRNRDPYRRSEMEWLFRRENLRVRSRILDRGRQFSEKVTISLHTFGNSAVGASGIDTPIEDQTWSGCFVERIRESDRGSSIGVQAWESIDF